MINLEGGPGKRDPYQQAASRKWTGITSELQWGILHCIPAGAHKIDGAGAGFVAEQLGPEATIVTVMCDTGMKCLRAYGTELSNRR